MIGRLRNTSAGRFIGRRSRLTAAVAVVGVVTAGAVAYATIPTDNVISSCYSRSGSALRVIDSSSPRGWMSERAARTRVRSVVSHQKGSTL